MHSHPAMRLFGSHRQISLIKFPNEKCIWHMFTNNLYKRITTSDKNQTREFYDFRNCLSSFVSDVTVNGKWNNLTSDGPWDQSLIKEWKQANIVFIHINVKNCLIIVFFQSIFLQSVFFYYFIYYFDLVWSILSL